MQKLYVMHYYFIAVLLFSASVFCSKISFCDRTPFPELCNSILGPIFEPHELHTNVSTTQAPLAPMANHTFDARAWMDCLDLYNDIVHHLNLSMVHMTPTDVEKWLSASLVNHQACQNGFKDSNLFLVLQNFLKSLVDLLANNKPLASDFSMASGHGLIKVVEGGVRMADLVVAQDGSGDFKTVGEAIKASETRRSRTGRTFIYVKSGVYKENIVITQSMTNLTLIGDGIDVTVITNDRSSIEGYTNSDTATAQIWGSGFLAVRITFENTAGPEKQQGIALLSASDLSVFYQCSFKGYQGTLSLLKFRQFYRECDIYGTVDFIFGDAAAVLQKCNIYVRNPLPGQQNTITAQGGPDPSSTTGFVMDHSRVTATPELIPIEGSVRTFLGRPWKDYSRVVFLKCFLDSLIDPLGWMPFEGDSAFDKVYYAEYMNTGVSGYTGGRATWPGYHDQMSDEEVQQFSVENFIAGESWIPSTEVPFDSTI